MTLISPPQLVIRIVKTFGLYVNDVICLAKSNSLHDGTLRLIRITINLRSMKKLPNPLAYTRGSQRATAD